MNKKEKPNDERWMFRAALSVADNFSRRSLREKLSPGDSFFFFLLQRLVIVKIENPKKATAFCNLNCWLLIIG